MLNRDFREIISAFNAGGVEYLVVGAYAVAAHGIARATQRLQQCTHAEMRLIANFRRQVLGLVLLTTACSPWSDDGRPGRVDIGLPAPTYATVSLEGDSVSLAALRDKVVLLNVWATWCHPCRTEIPELRDIHARYKDRGLDLVGVSVDAEGNDEGIREFMKEFDMQYPVWRDPSERVSTQFLVIGVPATFLIDREGILRWRKTGPIAPGDTSLTNAIERALAN